MNEEKLKQANQLRENIEEQEKTLNTLNNIIVRNNAEGIFLYSGSCGTVPMETTEFLVITRLLEIHHSRKLQELKAEFEAL